MNQEELSRDEGILRERAIVDAQVRGLLLDVILPTVKRVVAAHNELTHSEAKAWLNDNDTAVKVQKSVADMVQRRKYTAEIAIRRGDEPYEIVASGDKLDAKGSIVIGKAAIRADLESKELYLEAQGRGRITAIQLADMWVAVAFLDQVHNR